MPGAADRLKERYQPCHIRLFPENSRTGKSAEQGKGTGWKTFKSIRRI